MSKLRVMTLYTGHLGSMKYILIYRVYLNTVQKIAGIAGGQGREF